jgi:hypothetical protein
MQKKLPALMLVTVLTLICHQTACAYYDPGVQKWINRDPGVEAGFQGLTPRTAHSSDQVKHYTFVRNAPTTSVDPFGLAIWLCTRPTVDFPMYGYGRHAYLWDGRSPVQDHSCSQQSSYGSNSYGTAESSEEGPIGVTVSPYSDFTTGVKCEEVPGTEGHENDIMDYCRSHANDGPWWPGVYDCHSVALSILYHTGYPPREIPPRLDPGAPEWPLGLSWALFWGIVYGITPIP